MVVHRGERLDWYEGPTLLDVLESSPAGEASLQLRFPVQLVARSRFGDRQEHRGYLGRIESGSIEVGDVVAAWPQGQSAKVAEIVTLDGSPRIADAGQSITVVLDRQIDVARGDLLTHVEDAPTVSRRFVANLAWLDLEPLARERRYWLKHGTQTVRASIESLDSKLDLVTLEGAPATSLEFNDLGTVRIAAARPLPLDRYEDNRANGRFILIDEATQRTVAAGLVSEVSHG
jgi:sulfate adenylyltransferase subunit 1